MILSVQQIMSVTLEFCQRMKESGHHHHLAASLVMTVTTGSVPSHTQNGPKALSILVPCAPELMSERIELVQRFPIQMKLNV